MSNLVNHAKREIELIQPSGDDELIASLNDSIVKTVAAFAEFGHSGSSAAWATEILYKLLKFENLTPLTNNRAEWIDHTDISGGDPVFQSRRRADAFSKDGGKTHYLLDEPEKGVIVSANYED